MADATTNKTLKRILFAINNTSEKGLAQVAKTGKDIYDLTKTGIFDKHEADLVFRAYRHQKNKAGIKFDQPEAA
jgi:hypothetical protein